MKEEIEAQGEGRDEITPRSHLYSAILPDWKLGCGDSGHDVLLANSS